MFTNVTRSKLVEIGHFKQSDKIVSCSNISNCFAVSSRNKFVYILRHNVIQVIYQFQEDVVDCCFASKCLDKSRLCSKRPRFNNNEESLTDWKEFLCIATVDGSIFVIALPDSLHDPCIDQKQVICRTTVKIILSEERIVQLSNILSIIWCRDKMVVLSKNRVQIVDTELEEGDNEATAKASLKMVNVIELITFYNSQISVLPKLFAIQSESDRNRFLNSTMNCSVGNQEVLTISNVLFNSLFGRATNLIECPVLLIIGTDGTVYWTPLHPVSDSKKFPQLLCCHTDEIVNVMVVPRNDSTQAKLVIVGQSGSLLAIAVNPAAQPSTPVYGQSQILGPVVTCLALHQSGLLHSTGDDLYVTDLGTSIDAAPSKSSALGVYNIVEVAFIGAALPQRFPTVLVRSTNGRIYSMELASTEDGSSKDCSSLLNGCHQGTIRDLLTGIGKSADQLLSVTSEIQSHDKILEQLAFGSMLLSSAVQSEGDSTANSNSTTVPILCVAKPSMQDVGSTDCDCVVNVRLMNRSSFTFDVGWTFVVICEAGGFAACRELTHRCATELSSLYRTGFSNRTCVSRSIVGLANGMTENVTLTLELKKYNLPMTVKAMLIYTPPLHDLKCKSVVIPVLTRAIDEVDLMRSLSSPMPSQQRSLSVDCSFGEICNRLLSVCKPYSYETTLSNSGQLVRMAELRALWLSRSAKQHTVQVYIPAASVSHIPDKSPAGVLSWLLSNSELSADIASSSKTKSTFFTSTGHEVNLDITTISSNRLRLSICGSDIRNLVAIRLSVLLRTQRLCRGSDLFEADDVKRTKSRSRHRLQAQIDDLGLQLTPNFNADSNIFARLQQVFELYETIRSAHM